MDDELAKILSLYEDDLKYLKNQTYSLKAVPFLLKQNLIQYLKNHNDYKQAVENIHQHIGLSKKSMFQWYRRSQVPPERIPKKGFNQLHINYESIN